MSEKPSEEVALAGGIATEEVSLGTEEETEMVPSKGPETAPEEKTPDEKTETLAAPSGGNQAAEPLLSGHAGHALLTDLKVQANSMNAIRFAVFVDVSCMTCLQPNFPFMVIPNYNEDSFPDTEPFDTSSANYFIPMCAMLGSAIAGLVIGPLSDRIGRKKSIEMCLYMGAILSFVKWLCRKRFWHFCLANFANGLFGGSLPVAMAYCMDVYPGDKIAMDEAVGVLIGIFCLAYSAGNLIAIIMESAGLFDPLFVAIGLNVVAGVFATLYIVEPDKELFSKQHADGDEKKDEVQEDDGKPKELNYKVFAWINIGALIDNLGSMGMNLLMYPVMLTVWNLDLQPLPDGITDDMDDTVVKSATGYTLKELRDMFPCSDDDSATPCRPILFESAFKWVLTVIGLAVIPAVIASFPIYQKLGYAGGCAFGNFLTAIVQIVLLVISQQDASGTSLGFFIATLYFFMPLTTISQISTGPMLGVISPDDQKGFVTGVNKFTTDIGQAVGPWALGLIADNTTQDTAIWVAISLSFLACIVNFPLNYDSLHGFHFFPPKQKQDPESHHHLLDDAEAKSNEELTKLAENGKWIPAEKLDEINFQRAMAGQPFLRLPYGSFEDDADELEKLQDRAAYDFKYMAKSFSKYLNICKDKGERENFVKMINGARPSEAEQAKSKKELGEWFTDYLIAQGYWIENDPMMMKQMIVNSFPMMEGKGEITSENIRDRITQFMRVVAKHAQAADKEAEHHKSSLALLSKQAVTRTNSKLKKTQ